MTGKKAKEQFVKMPRELLQSDAWRALGVNERRLCDFLMLEHMRHGGRQNGNLLAPHRQLVEFGIGGRFIAGTFRNLEKRGLIRCQRHDAYSPNTYTLTWRSSCGTPPTNDWRQCLVLHEGAARSGSNADVKRCSTSASRRCSTRVQTPDSRVVDFQKVSAPVLHEGAALYRSSYQGGHSLSVESDDRQGSQDEPTERAV